MSALRDSLVAGIGSRTLTGIQETEWDAFAAALNDGSDLESALTAVDDRDLLKTITAHTGSFIASTDREYAYRIAQGGVEWPAAGLLKKLVDSLPEGDRILHTLTPNYDMLLEYACDHARILYTNGFSGGIERKLDWPATSRALLVGTRVQRGRKLEIVYKKRKHVRLYKVHGSLNYFFHRNDVVENNAWMWNPPDFAERVMITPGLSKYETLQRYRRELLKAADEAIENATHFLFLGYGFNDKHLEEYITRKLVNQKCNGVIVTRDVNPRIDALLSQAQNLWLVCKTDVANSNGTRIFNRQYSDWLSLPTKKLWDVAEFTTSILGG